MTQTFDEAYAEYQRLLILLNESNDIPTKNALFKQLTQLLSQMENHIISQAMAQDAECSPEAKAKTGREESVEPGGSKARPPATEPARR